MAKIELKYFICILLVSASCHGSIEPTLKDLLTCQISIQSSHFSCIKNTTIIACPINHDLSPHGLNSSIFVLGFLPLSSISELTTETRLPLFAIAENLIDFKNYSISGIEYTLHHAETKSGKGVQVASLSCFEKLWQMFKTFGHRRIISLETDVKGFLPTASVFGKVKLV